MGQKGLKEWRRWEADDQEIPQTSDNNCSTYYHYWPTKPKAANKLPLSNSPATIQGNSQHPQSLIRESWKGRSYLERRKATLKKPPESLVLGSVYTSLVRFF